MALSSFLGNRETCFLINVNVIMPAITITDNSQQQGDGEGCWPLATHQKRGKWWLQVCNKAI